MSCALSKLGSHCPVWLLLACLTLFGCQQKMAVQPSLKPMRACGFGPHGAASRLPAPGTIARGHLRTDSAFYRGRPRLETDDEQADNQRVKAAEPSAQPTVSAEAEQNANVVTEFPLPVTRELVEHGRNRYMIYCVVCHDALGTGRGKIVERGYTRPPSYHIRRLREAPVGHLFVVASEGYGSMPAYAREIPARDRWAIVAYVRALQLSQHFPEADLTDEMRRERDEAKRPTSAEEAAP
ncbi:MAG TPA: cytochrome c [Pirellulales bacterium]|nr:cytochrome c [Pirellulales bacterium]